jgi:hypothetical protein
MLEVTSFYCLILEGGDSMVKLTYQGVTGVTIQKPSDAGRSGDGK